MHQHPRVLLGMKKRGFGEGWWNGFGGKVHDGETIEQAAHRELEEEAGIRARDLEPAGTMEFHFPEREPLEVHLFRVNEFDGVPQESEEMKPAWFTIDEIPFAHMWPDDRYWFPLFLKHRKFTGKVVFDKDNKIIDYHFEMVA